jgi:hypothetical protein
VAGEVLVDRVVDDLVDQVVEASAVIGVPDVHAGPLPDALQAFEDADAARIVIRLGSVRTDSRIGHYSVLLGRWVSYHIQPGLGRPYATPFRRVNWLL